MKTLNFAVIPAILAVCFIVACGDGVAPGQTPPTPTPGVERTATATAGTPLATVTGTTTPSATSTPIAIPAGRGAIAGRVTRGPICPVQTVPPRPECEDAPVAGIVLTASRNGAQVASATTGGDGRYLFLLTPGSYTIEIAPLPAPTFTKDLPRSITVREGDTVTLDVLIDTGVR
ncbi:MAG TPA: carboxypeptidase-like regulatory domain-containing protein [Dehalococcoidia bacterium]|nr:carboxypeptidase-like regulatory domain-containing protein [Dehalococcoidia bacterium]